MSAGSLQPQRDVAAAGEGVFLRKPQKIGFASDGLVKWLPQASDRSMAKEEVNCGSSAGVNPHGFGFTAVFGSIAK